MSISLMVSYNTFDEEAVPVEEGVVDVVEDLQGHPVLQPHRALVLLARKLTVQLHALPAVT